MNTRRLLAIVVVVVVLGIISWLAFAPTPSEPQLAVPVSEPAPINASQTPQAESSSSIRVDCDHVSAIERPHCESWQSMALPKDPIEAAAAINAKYEKDGR